MGCVHFNEGNAGFRHEVIITAKNITRGNFLLLIAGGNIVV